LFWKSLCMYGERCSLDHSSILASDQGLPICRVCRSLYQTHMSWAFHVFASDHLSSLASLLRCEPFMFCHYHHSCIPVCAPLHCTSTLLVAWLIPLCPLNCTSVSLSQSCRPVCLHSVSHRIALKLIALGPPALRSPSSALALSESVSLVAKISDYSNSIIIISTFFVHHHCY
jgi:hypothetical protein